MGTEITGEFIEIIEIKNNLIINISFSFTLRSHWKIPHWEENIPVVC